MKVELKKVKYFPSMSEETSCFQAEVWINGKRAGYAENRGHGGCTDCRIEDKTLEKAFWAYAKSLPAKELALGEEKSFKVAMSPDFLIDCLFDDWLKVKEDQKISRIDEKEKAKNIARGCLTVRFKFTNEYRWAGIRSVEDIPKLVEKMKNKPIESVVLA